MVSAVLHMDEATPHIHATIVPVVTGERRKAKKKREVETKKESGNISIEHCTDNNTNKSKKKYRKKKSDTVRLCADDVMARDRLIGYQDTYALKMKVYGLERGIEGSSARYIASSQYYRDLLVQKNDILESVQYLSVQKDEVQEKIYDLYEQKDVVKGDFLMIYQRLREKEEELKLLLGKIKEAERVLDPDNIRKDLNFIKMMFPEIPRLLRWVYFCLNTGFSQEQTKSILNNQSISFTGRLYSKEHNKYFNLTEAKVAFAKDSQTSRYVLIINSSPIQTWIKIQNNRLLNIGNNIEKGQRRL